MFLCHIEVVSFGGIIVRVTRLMFIKHYAPNRCLCIKVANNVQFITGLRIAEMSQLQNCSIMCTKDGSYCEKEKKVLGRGGGGQGRCERRSEAFVKIQKFYFIYFFLGGGGGGGVRVDVN